MKEVYNKTGRTLEEIADKINPILTGWINYYRIYHKREFNSILNQFDHILVHWAQNKYKKIGKRGGKAWKWLANMKESNPKIFVHWKIPY